MLRRSITVTAISSALLLAACLGNEADPSQEGTTSTARLQEGEWTVEDIGGQGVIDDSRPTLLFAEDGRLSGNASCNRLIASYTVQGDKLSISPGGLTMMACPPALMDQERKLVDLLGTVATYRIDESGALVLGSASGKQIIARR